MGLLAHGAAELRELAATGEVRPTEIVDACVRRIAGRDGALGAFLSVEEEWARARARELEEQRASGAEPGPLFGVPVALKDNIALRGWPLTCASRILDGHKAAYTSTAVQRLLDAGAIPIGRCNMDEFGFGSSTEHSAFQSTRNPWNPERIPGGSSGGSAVAVAARMVPVALGSDTGGSIRQPAALCGVCGLKPTYGRVSRFGLVAFGSSLDQIGPLTRSSRDAALVLSVLAGRDPRDATTLDASLDVTLDVTLGHGEPAESLAGLRVGLPAQYFDDGVDDAVRGRVRAASDVLRELGAELVDVDLPLTPFAIPTYYLVATSEASSNLARFDGIRYGRPEPAGELLDHYLATRGKGFGDEAKRRILLGTFCLSAGYYDAYYLEALKARTMLRREFEQVFGQVDVLLGPTTPFPPFRLGESAHDPLKLYLCDVLTTPANLAGIPAISVPCGHDAGGMPVGMQLQGPALAEATLLRVAGAYQHATRFHEETPSEVHA